MSSMDNRYIDNTNFQIQQKRDKAIRLINEQPDSNEFIRVNSVPLYNLGLTMYAGRDSFKSIIYNEIHKSKLDNSYSLHPDQVRVLNLLSRENALIISAPTSFGKTFTVFEYIYINKPKIVVMVVPTLSLVDEYIKRVIKKYKEKFHDYKVYINVDSNREYDFSKNSIFILTHDKAITNDITNIINDIDFLVVDEVYKLEQNISDDRVIVLNIAYYELAKRSKKYVLLAPFIEDVVNREKLVNYPYFFKTDYSPVYNNVISREIRTDSRKERFLECKKILGELDSGSKTLIYFSKVTDLNYFINNVLLDYDEIEISSNNVKSFINWAANEIHEEWSFLKALKRGFLVHNGQITRGAKSYSLFLFENNNDFNRLLCTSSLLEGVNTVAENIIITKPKNNENEFTAFDFFNLVGRSGRLNKYYVGNAYYIKSPEDALYEKQLAAHKIEFELTANTEDMKVALGSLDSDDFNEFLKELGITFDEYKNNIGIRNRFSSTVKNLFEAFKNKKVSLINELNNLACNEDRSSYELIKIVFEILNYGANTYEITNGSLIINYLLNKKQLPIKTIVNFMQNKSNSVDSCINKVIKFKYSYLEHEFYNKTNIVYYFLKLNNVSDESLCIFKSKILTSIETVYYLNDSKRRMLFEYGIYDRDINKIVEIIGNDFENVGEMVELLHKCKEELKNHISFMSNFIIENVN